MPRTVDPEALRRLEVPIGGTEHTPRGDEAARRCELLDAVVPRIRDVDVSTRIDRDAGWIGKCTVKASCTAPLADEIARRIEFLDPLIVRVRDIDVSAGSDGDGCGIVQ